MHEVKVDDRNRVAIPARFVDTLRKLAAPDGTEPSPEDPVEVVIALDLEERVSIYPKKVYQDFKGYLGLQDQYDPDWSRIRSVVLGSADPQVLDKQNRIKVPALLKKWARLDEEIVLQGVGERLQMLSKKMWEENLTEFGESIARVLRKGARKAEG